MYCLKSNKGSTPCPFGSLVPPARVLLDVDLETWRTLPLCYNCYFGEDKVKMKDRCSHTDIYCTQRALAYQTIQLYTKINTDNQLGAGHHFALCNTCYCTTLLFC